MFGSWSEPEEPNPLDEQIATVLSEMKRVGPTDDTYDSLMRKLERLEALKAPNKPKRLSRDTMLMAAVGLGQVLFIVLAERQSVLSQKAVGFVHRPFGK